MTHGGNVIHWDEVRHYMEFLYVNSTEAAWTLVSFPLTNRSHSVMTLPVHKEDKQGVVVVESLSEGEMRRGIQRPSKLMDWFALNTRQGNRRPPIHIRRNPRSLRVVV